MEGTEAALIASNGEEITLATEHHSRRVIAGGDAAGVRANLVFALEKLDYFVEHEEPLLIAKRKTPLSGYSGKLIAGNVLPYVKRLQISLTPLTDRKFLPLPKRQIPMTATATPTAVCAKRSLPPMPILTRVRSHLTIKSSAPPRKQLHSQPVSWFWKKTAGLS